MATVFDDGRLEADGTAAATHRSATTEERTRFGFDTIGRFFTTHLVTEPATAQNATALKTKESA
ncbi:hypothetical protein ACWDTI_02425 [Gordonia sp. NPDC003424]